MLQQARISILGASRGLGRAIAEELAPWNQLLLISRQVQKLKDLMPANSRSEFFAHDFSKADQFEILLKELNRFQPTHLIYAAGGGTYGPYGEKKWESHLWTYHVNFLTPARLIHESLRARHITIQQVIHVGSQVAENNPEPRGATYAASKRGMRGLIESVQAEAPSLDVRLYSPGYMDTELLPKGAWPRQIAGQIAAPSDVARDLCRWMSDASQRGKNRVFAR